MQRDGLLCPQIGSPIIQTGKAMDLQVGGRTSEELDAASITLLIIVLGYSTGVPQMGQF